MMRDNPSLQPQAPTRSVSAGRWSRATARARAVSRVRRGLAPGDAAAGPSQEPAATGVQSAQGNGGSRKDIHRGASPARSLTPPRLQAAVRTVRAANRLALHKPVAREPQPMETPTETSSWVGSVVEEDAKAETQEEAAAAARGETEQEKDTGAPSMYNTATKETSLAAPATLASVNVRRGASPARSSTPPRLQAAVRKVRAANRAAHKDHDEPQFTEHFDEETGRAYFVNKKTGTSSWRRPARLRSPWYCAPSAGTRPSPVSKNDGG